MADILTLNEYKTLSGITNTKKDAMYTAMLPAVSQAVTSYAGRDFNQSPVTEVRSYQYDGSEYLDIDDATTISGVSITIPGGTDYVMGVDEYLPQPARRDDSPVYHYLILFSWVFGVSPEMGFTRNLDVYAREGRWLSKPAVVNVTGTWGWATIPDDVKMAAKWTLDDWVARRPETAAPAEAIESYSRQWGSFRGEALSLGIPYRARDLLAAYTKVYV
jgi:hypothetical protein